jgi:hypothetical protein
MPSIDLSRHHVIMMVSNPMRYESRFDLYRQAAPDLIRKGGNLWVVEVGTGARIHQITDDAKPQEFLISSSNLTGIVWIKENVQNVAAAILTTHRPDWRTVCFTDSDVRYEQGWVEETVHALQLHPVVQPWSHAVDMGPDGGAVSNRMQESFAYCYHHGIEVKSATTYTKGGHPGYSLAFRREAFNALGGLIETGALGSGDRHMCTALIGKVHESYHPDVSKGYKRPLQIWQQRADRWIRGNFGYVPCVIRHGFHGLKTNRGYGSRWQILVKHGFDPATDLKKDSAGILTLVDETTRQRAFRDDTYRYYRSRREDSK